MLDYHVPKGGRYWVLETYNNADDKSRIIHVLDFGLTPNLTVGRCRESNLKITDNSVSRLHSEIITYGNKFYHMDLQSKFGTLRVFRKPLKISNSLIIQSGWTVMRFKLESPRENWCEKWFGSRSRYRPHPFLGYYLVSLLHFLYMNHWLFI